MNATETGGKLQEFFQCGFGSSTGRRSGRTRIDRRLCRADVINKDE